MGLFSTMAQYLVGSWQKTALGDYGQFQEGDLDIVVPGRGDQVDIVDMIDTHQLINRTAKNMVDVNNDGSWRVKK